MSQSELATRVAYDDNYLAVTNPTLRTRFENSALQVRKDEGEKNENTGLD